MSNDEAMKTTIIPTDEPVLVTGATGYVAGRLIQDLLTEGVTVHGTVRDVSKKSKYQHLVNIASKTKGTFQAFQADLMEDGSFRDAMKGCRIVFHTASPFPDTIEDPLEDVVRPAVDGTKNVIRQAMKTDTVKRIVLTSSNMAMFTDSMDVKGSKTGVLDESCWNTTASLDYQPYAYSKTLAEKTAWEMVQLQSTQFDLVSINPGLVVGPGAKCHPESQSVSLVQGMADGTFASGIPKLDMACVDIREVSRAHIEAAYNPNAKGRYLVCHHETNFYEMSNLLKERYPQYPFATMVAPKPILFLFGPCIDSRMNRRYVYRNVAIGFHVDSTKTQSELGITFRPLSESLFEMMDQIVEAGLLDGKEKKK